MPAPGRTRGGCLLCLSTATRATLSRVTAPEAARSLSPLPPWCPLLLGLPLVLHYLLSRACQYSLWVVLSSACILAPVASSLLSCCPGRARIHHPLVIAACPYLAVPCRVCCVFRVLHCRRFFPPLVQTPASLCSCSSHGRACCLFTLECHRPYPRTYPCVRRPRACLACSCA